MSLRQPEYVNLRYDELLALSETTVLEMTVEMSLVVEEETRLQASQGCGSHLELAELQHQNEVCLPCKPSQPFSVSH